MALVAGNDDGGPVKTGFSYGDLTAAHVATFAILAAITERDRSGLGQIIDVAMHDALVFLTQLGWPEVPNPRHRVEARDGQWTLAVSRVKSTNRCWKWRRRSTATTPGDVTRCAQVRAADDAGSWQVLASPIRWRAAPADHGTFVAVTGAGNALAQATAAN